MFAMIFASCTGNGPNSFIEISFGSAHAADFVPALARQRKQLHNPTVVIIAKGCPNFSKLAVRQNPVTCPGSGRAIGAKHWIGRNIKSFSDRPVEHSGQSGTRPGLLLQFRDPSQSPPCERRYGGAGYGPQAWNEGLFRWTADTARSHSMFGVEASVWPASNIDRQFCGVFR